MAETKTRLDALVAHLESVAVMAGQVDAVRYVTTDPTAGFDLAAIVEGGVPEVTHPLEQEIRDEGGDPDGVYWRCYCAGFKGLTLLREHLKLMETDRNAPPPAAYAMDPVEWMQARADAIVAEQREARHG